MHTKEEPTGKDRGLKEIQDNKTNTSKLTHGSSEINNDSRLPILRGFRVKGLVFVHCPWCDRMHVHGWGRTDSARVIEVRRAWRSSTTRTVRVSNKRVSTK